MSRLKKISFEKDIKFLQKVGSKKIQQILAEIEDNNGLDTEFESIYDVDWSEVANLEPEKFKSIIDIIKDFFTRHPEKQK